jgi:hypothetical protein
MKYEYVKFLITEESKPESIALKLNQKASNFGKNGTLETEEFLKSIAKMAKKNKRFPIGNSHFIDPKNQKEIDEYIKMIIDNLDIEDTNIRNNIIHTLYKLKEFLPLAYDDKLS